MIARTLPYLMITIIMAVAVLPAKAAVEIGKPAPAISATDIHGNNSIWITTKAKSLYWNGSTKDARTFKNFMTAVICKNIKKMLPSRILHG